MATRPAVGRTMAISGHIEIATVTRLDLVREIMTGEIIGIEVAIMLDREIETETGMMINGSLRP